MIQASLTFNDWLQWATVAAILIIVAITVVRKIVRFNRAMKRATAVADARDAPPLATSRKHTANQKVKDK